MRIMRGFWSTVCRESIYTMGYLGIAPIVQNHLTNKGGWYAEHPLTTSILAACMAGSFSASCSHPADTAKTCMQADIEGTKYPTAMSAAKQLSQNHGVQILFKV